jgi:hypothetical protein
VRQLIIKTFFLLIFSTKTVLSCSCAPPKDDTTYSNIFLAAFTKTVGKPIFEVKVIKVFKGELYDTYSFENSTWDCGLSLDQSDTILIFTNRSFPTNHLSVSICDPSINLRFSRTSRQNLIAYYDKVFIKAQKTIKNRKIETFNIIVLASSGLILLILSVFLIYRLRIKTRRTF